MVRIIEFYKYLNCAYKKEFISVNENLVYNCCNADEN